MNINLNIRESIGLIGESGSGKSTLAQAILGVLPENAIVTKGKIIFKGVDLIENKKEIERLRKKDISIVFQDPYSYLTPVMKIGELLIEKLKLCYPNMTNENARKKAKELLSLVKIPDPENVLDRYPFQLSGGMAQRVSIALAISTNPSLLIADEPTSALDLTTQAQIIKLLKNLSSNFNVALFLITHDLSLVSNLVNRVYIMYSGKIVEEDNTVGLYRNPKHPYTKLLLESVKKLQGLQTNGSIMDIRKSGEGNINGCAFRDRCPFATNKCVNEPPPIEIFPNKKVYCWIYVE
ncbi:MAG: ABC transporter ATP-binding protein [Nitrososphaeria archaeon]